MCDGLCVQPDGWSMLLWVWNISAYALVVTLRGATNFFHVVHEAICS